MSEGPRVRNASPDETRIPESSLAEADHIELLRYYTQIITKCTKLTIYKWFRKDIRNTQFRGNVRYNKLLLLDIFTSTKVT